MVARNEKKMEGKIEEIKAAYPMVQCKAVVCDFSKITKMSEYRAVLDEVVGGYDIAIGIANAGYALA